MTLPQTVELAPGYSISRIIKGGWQLSGDHGPVDADGAILDMAAYYEAGITTFDCADIYTGVEEKIGEFRKYYLRKHGEQGLRNLKVHTKYVPDLSTLGTVDRAGVAQTIERSIRRLGVERLDLVQFHWWDYGVPRYVEVAGWLCELQKEGKIDRISGTNFDTIRTRELVESGVPLTSMQVQYSLLDQRPARQFAAFARSNNISFLCYGAVAGGFLSDRWLGVDDPGESFANRSLVKYKLIIDDFGGWALYQRLLSVLKAVGDRHGVSISTVAMRWVLDQPQVAAVLVGVRRGDHLPEHQKVLGLALLPEDHAALNEVLREARPVAGDVYAVERDLEGRHGRIMKYELNGVAA
ncbi:MAG TPA: aldo/keto reductase [Ramlibacter sp.]|nr:aldo/keto reductase [Ramlibacter sp.]